MFATARSLFIMFMMPLVMLLAWAHLLRQTWNDGGYLPMIAAGLVGVAGVATAPWPDKRRAVIAAVYLVALIAALPFLTLLAVCSTGDCL